jgi:hypothetical protein
MCWLLLLKRRLLLLCWLRLLLRPSLSWLACTWPCALARPCAGSRRRSTTQPCSASSAAGPCRPCRTARSACGRVGGRGCEGGREGVLALGERCMQLPADAEHVPPTFHDRAGAVEVWLTCCSTGSALRQHVHQGGDGHAAQLKWTSAGAGAGATGAAGAGSGAMQHILHLDPAGKAGGRQRPHLCGSEEDD